MTGSAPARSSHLTTQGSISRQGPGNFRVDSFATARPSAVPRVAITYAINIDIFLSRVQLPTSSQLAYYAIALGMASPDHTSAHWNVFPEFEETDPMVLGGKLRRVAGKLAHLATRLGEAKIVRLKQGRWTRPPVAFPGDSGGRWLKSSRPEGISRSAFRAPLEVHTRNQKPETITQRRANHTKTKTWLRRVS
jgi:hypothetical protein